MEIFVMVTYFSLQSVHWSEQLLKPCTTAQSLRIYYITWNML